MNLSEISLKRPVMAIVFSIVIVLFGAIGFNYLGVRGYPAIDPPNVSVRTSYQGANSDIIETQITEPLEKAINGIAGVVNITSSSSQGTSSINVEFAIGEDLESAANDVRDKVSQALRSLPPDLDAPPVISKADASGDPILAMTVQSNTRNQLQVTEYATNNLLERLQTIPGVSEISIWGEKKYAMRIWFNPDRMHALDVTFEEIQAALLRENVELPSGKLSGTASELTIRTFAKINTEEEFAKLIVKNVNGREVHLGDVSEAVLGPENVESVLKESGVPMIALAVIPQPGSNYVSISKEFYKRYEQIKKELPGDMKLDIALDQTISIKKSISEVKETLLIAFLLVVLIIYLFFRDWLIAFRPLIDIPVSLLGAFFIMYIFGFSINVLTLLAIVLATGLVVDDGIVVTENIYKKMEAGLDKYTAAREGSNEIYFAVIATSITLAAVFLPIIFLEGFVGRLFREFGIVVAGAVLISAFVSLTLTPVLNIKMSRKVHKHSKFYNKTEFIFKGMEDWYNRILKAFIKYRGWAIVIILACFAIIFLIGKIIPSELAPLEDKSQFRLSVSAPEGTAYTYMDNFMDKISTFLKDSIPESKVIISFTAPGFAGAGSVNSGFARVVLVEPDERERSQQEIVDMVNKNSKKFTEGRVSAIQEQTISVNRRGGQPVQFVLQHVNFEKLKEKLPIILEEAQASKILSGADVDLKFNKPELRVLIDRQKASALGVSVQAIASALQLAYSSRRLGYFDKDGKQYQIIGQVDVTDRDNPADLNNIFVRNSRGEQLSINNFASYEEQSSPPTIYHFNRYKSATISANTEKGFTVGDGIKEMQRIADKNLDDTFQTALTGTSRDFQESGSNTAFAFILALILIYLILAAQFESFTDPFIIMITVPLALAGALLSLQLFGQTLNIFSQIGMIMLIGLVTKNGILIVEFANKKREEGIDKFQAVREASVARLRPILMTSLAMSLGALPLALSLGDASTSRIPLGIVIVGGVMFSLVLTLLVIPAMYTFLSRKRGSNELEMADI